MFTVMSLLVGLPRRISLPRGLSLLTALTPSPGFYPPVGPPLLRHVGLFRYLSRLMAQSPVMGALPTLYAALAPEISGGDFCGPSGWGQRRGRPAKMRSCERSFDEETAAKLWAVSEEMTGVKFVI